MVHCASVVQDAVQLFEILAMSADIQKKIQLAPN